jgi:hypothetical protein
MKMMGEEYNSLGDASVNSRGDIQMMLKSAFFARRNFTMMFQAGEE